jgi:hypothetical protein
VQVRYDEGVAIHIGPKPCAVAREGGSEASVGECAGQPLSPEKILSRTPTSLRRRKATRRYAPVQASRRSGVVGDPGMHRRSLSGNREIPRLTLGLICIKVRDGKARSRSRQ